MAPLLWIFVMLNYLYCDVLSLFNREELEQVLSGSVGGVEMTPTRLLGAGILMEIPMVMILVSRLASQRIARWASVAAGVLMVVVQIGSLGVGDNSPHYLFFSAVEIATVAVIAWYAATRWKSGD